MPGIGPAIIKDDTVSVGAGAVKRSTWFDLTGLNNFALEYTVSGTGAPDVKIEVEQTSDKDDDDSWYKPNNIGNVVTSTSDKNPHGAHLPPITVKYLRFKITELTTVVADTSVLLKVSGQKKYDH